MIWMLLAVMNLLSFTLMGIDKMKAKRGAWRIPEKALFLATALFGGLGGVLGMLLGVPICAIVYNELRSFVHRKDEENAILQAQVVEEDPVSEQKAE